MKRRGKTRGVDAEGKTERGNTPPVETRWKPGCTSPNPKGRPRTSVFSQEVKAALAEVDPKLQKSMVERLVEMACRRALQGSYKHLELLLGYAEGRPAQSVDLTTKILKPEEHAESILAALDRLPEADGRSDTKRPN